MGSFKQLGGFWGFEAEGELCGGRLRGVEEQGRRARG